MSTFQIYERLKRTMNPEAAEAIANALDEVVIGIQQTVRREDFSELREIVADLGLAQKRTEQRLDSLTLKVEELAEAQKRTEQRLDSLTQKVEELAEAQKRTEQKVEELAEAQKRTEQKVEELAEAQKRTEQRLDSLTLKVEELAEAQKHTEQAIEKLAEAQGRTEQKVEQLFANFDRRLGVLGSRWGDGAERAFRQGLLESLKGLGYVVESFRGQDPEGFINHKPRSYDLDILILNGTTVAAEIKANASGADVTEFHRSVLLYEKQTGRKVSKAIIVAVTIQRRAIENAQECGVIVATNFDDLRSE
jgi:hypothetical protein